MGLIQAWGAYCVVGAEMVTWGRLRSARMVAAPRNAASDKFTADFARMGDRRWVESEMLASFADDFVRDDRRRLLSFEATTAQDLVDVALAWFEVDAGRPSFEPVAVLAVRGDRLALVRWRVVFGNGFVSEMLGVQQFDELIERHERLVVFDVDDVDSALAELDRLHALIQLDEA